MADKRKKDDKKAERRDKAGRRVYLDEERYAALVVLDTNGGNVPLTAVSLGIPERTLRAWAVGFRHAEAAELYREKKADAANAFETILWEILPVARDKIGDASFRELMTGAGIAVDKMKLLRGEPTNININADGGAGTNDTGYTLRELAEEMTIDERKQMRNLIQRAQARQEVQRAQERQESRPDARQLPPAAPPFAERPEGE